MDENEVCARMTLFKNLEIIRRDLFLSRDFHCLVAIVIVKTVYTFAEETLPAGSAAIISQGVRQVSDTPAAISSKCLQSYSTIDDCHSQ